ncbi:MAG TPA: hypothetical protein VM658_06480 [bacterium]|nr:hypothetical protein [bacterium]
MCGIAGIAGPGASRCREAVLRMVQALTHPNGMFVRGRHLRANAPGR